jgi:bacterioferritin (cytochrome b1)
MCLEPLNRAKDTMSPTTRPLDINTLPTRSHAEYAEGSNLAEMISENLIAERIAIDSYHHTLSSLGHKDPTAQRPLESIRAVEEEHADDRADLLQQVSQPPPLSKIGSQAIRRFGPKPSTDSKKHHKEKS